MLIKLSGKNFQQAGFKFTYVIWCYAMNKLYHLRHCRSCSVGRHKWFVCCETELEQKKKWEWHSCRKSPRSRFMPQWSRVKATWWDKVAHTCIRVAVSLSFVCFFFLSPFCSNMKNYPTHCKYTSQPSHGPILHRNTIICPSATLDINEGNLPPIFSRDLTLIFQLQ